MEDYRCNKRAPRQSTFVREVDLTGKSLHIDQSLDTRLMDVKMALISFIYVGSCNRNKDWRIISEGTAKTVFHLLASVYLYVYGGCDNSELTINICIQPPAASCVVDIVCHPQLMKG